MSDVRRILLVEDNPLDVRLLQEICRDDPDWRVAFDLAASLEEAQQRMRASGHDVVLLDLGLPESDGLDSLRQFLELQRGCRHSGALIILTSVDSEHIGDQAIAMGAQDFLRKGDIDVHQLRRAVRYACERQRALVAQRESDARIALMATALDQASDAIIITTVDGEICYVNQAFSRITGYSYEEAIGRNPAMLSSGKQSPTFYQRMWHTISQGEAWESEMVDRRKNGSFYPCHLEIAPVSNEQGEITHFVGIQRDLTEYKLLEERLRQNQKMEAIGTLTGGVAHDFNNMLAGISGNVFLARRNIDKSDRLLHHLDVIETICARSSEMIKKMMAFGRNDMVQMVPMELNALLQEVHSMVARLFPASIRIRMDLCEEPLVIQGDNAQLHQVLLNLFNNARDAIEAKQENGEIVCSLRPFTPDAGFVRLHPETEGRTFALLTVCDSGPGVDEDTLRHLTEPFFTTKEVGSGTGLGLSMVDGAVDQHHGILQMSSRLGEGLRVEIYLPRLSETQSQDATNTVPSSNHDADQVFSGHGETILLADDEDDVRAMLCETLGHMGYRVIAARDGAEALEHFRKHRLAIRLVLLDVVMPELGGPDCYRKMLEIWRDLPVIFASGYERTRIPSELLAGAHQRCLRKPFSIPHLSRMIHTLLHGHAS